MKKIKIAVLINPVAGNGRGVKLRNAVERELKKNRDLRQAVVCVKFTGRNNENEWIDAEVLEADVAVVCGGDGTAHQAVNGLMRKSFRNGLAVYPIGTGNDLYRALYGGKTDIVSFLMKIANSPEWDELDVFSINDKVYFSNSAGFGYDAKVVNFYEKTVAWLGKNPVIKIPFFKMGLWVALGLPLFLVCGREVNVIANGRDYFSIIFNSIKSYGGGSILSESSSHSDGILEALYCESRLKFLSFILNRPVLGTTFFTPGAEQAAPPVSFSLKKPAPVQVDGDDYTSFFADCRDFRITLAGRMQICK